MTGETEHLIDTLAVALRPTPPFTLERRIVGWLLIGMTVSGVIMAIGLGIRADLVVALQGFTFWMKAGYSAILAVIAAAASMHLARPGSRAPRWLWLLAVPILAIAALAIAELVRTPSQDWRALWLGKSGLVCPFLVLGLSAPILVGLLLAEAKLAPTRLRAAGTMIGVTAGSSAALIYCLHCPESSALFLLTWYSAGIGLAGLAGRFLGPRLLRW